jgi:hypothetical protein
MPNGGQIGQAIGLALQPQTPGNPDIGNADITGAMVAGEFNTRLINNSFIGTPSLYGDYVVFGRTFTNKRDVGSPGNRSVYIGSNMEEGQNLVAGSGNNVGIGFQVKNYKNQAVAIGYAATTCNSDATSENGLVAIGWGSIANGGGLGSGYSMALGGSGTVAVGTRCCAISIGGPNHQAKGTGVMCIGWVDQSANGNRTNFMYINNNDTAPYAPSAADDNSIKIGNAVQTKVTIGPYVITAGFSTPSFLQTASVTVGNTIVETTLAGTGVGTLVIAAGRLAVGSTVRLKARGYITDTGTPTLQLRAKLGPSGTFVDLGAFNLPTITGTHGWTFDGEVTVRTNGAGGTAIAQGTLTIGGATPVTLTSSANTSAQAINTTIPQTLDLTAQWGTADPANTLTSTNVTMELVG